MSLDTNRHTLTTLVDLVTERPVNTKSIQKALQLICQSYGFDGGAVYESDFQEHYCVQERYTPGDSRERSLLRLLGEPLSHEKELLLERVIFWGKGSSSPAIATQLLELYKAEAIAVAPALGEDQHLYGLLLFYSTKPWTIPAEQNREVRSALSLLLRYLEARIYQRRLVQSRSLLENVLDNTNIDIYVNDFFTHEILYTNKSMAKPYGGVEKLMGRKCWQALFPGQTGPCEFCPQVKLTDDEGNPTKVYSWDYQRPFDGSWFRVFSTAFRWVDGRLAHLVSSADITDNIHNIELVKYLANYDQLTSLPNRRMLVEECERRINNATDTEYSYLMFFDIDGFKPINDTLGHDAGDEFLVQLGAFFSGIPLLKNAIYRNGGDEFVAIVDGEGVTKENIENLAGFIHQRFQNPWKLKKGSVLCGTSIGIACYPQDGNTAEALLQKADKAMYRAKKNGGRQTCFAD